MEENKILKKANGAKGTALMERHKIVILEGLPGIGRFAKDALIKIRPKKFRYINLGTFNAGTFNVIKFLSLMAKRISIGSIYRSISFLLARFELGKIAWRLSTEENVLMLRYLPSVEAMEEILNPKNVEIIREIINQERNLPDSLCQYILVDIDYEDRSLKMKLDFLQFEKLRGIYKKIATDRNWLIVSGKELEIFLKNYFGEE